MTWTQKAEAVFAETQQALQTIFDALIKGQQSKILKNEEVKALLEKYHISKEESQ